MAVASERSLCGCAVFATPVPESPELVLGQGNLNVTIASPSPTACSQKAAVARAEPITAESSQPAESLSGIPRLKRPQRALPW
jgi:hypothetical protein